MTIPFSGPGVYLTVGGFLVELHKDRRAQKEFSPGVNVFGQTIHEVDFGHGWSWNEDGTVSLYGPWSAKLRLSQKLALQLIPAPPHGFKYAGGYPMFRTIKQNEYGMLLNGALYKHIPDTESSGNYIPLEKVEPKYYECDSPDPSYVVRKGDQFFWANEWVDTDKCVGMTVENAFRPILKMRSLSPFPTKPEEVWYTVTNPDYVLVEGDQYQNIKDDERWYSIVSSIGQTTKQAKFDGPNWKCRSKNKKACLSSAPKETPDTNFNLTKVADLTTTLVKPSLLKRSLNWWVVEPVSNAFRYAVITAVLWGGVEIYKNPSVVWKILPKISVTIK